jgi:3-oxoacyl-[acyl-carrier protein] reductase
MRLGLENKVALVGGASRGIGLAIAQALQAEGCQLAIAARGREGLNEAAGLLGPQVLAQAADLADPASCDALVEAVTRQFGRLDLVIANAGSGASTPPGQETHQAWREAIDINLMTAVNLMGAARKAVAASGGGSMVCISSICGREALGAPVTYSAAKAALDMAVKGLSRAYAADGIRVNGVAPGNILFPGGAWQRKLDAGQETVEAMIARETPLGRFGTPQEVADAVLFLSSERSAFTTGAILVVDGGQTRT